MVFESLKEIEKAKEKLIHEIVHFDSSHVLNTDVKKLNRYNGKSYQTRPEIVKVLGIEVALDDPGAFKTLFSSAYKDVKRAHYSGANHPLATLDRGLHAVARKCLEYGIDPVEFESFVLAILSLEYDELPARFH